MKVFHSKGGNMDVRDREVVVGAGYYCEVVCKYVDRMKGRDAKYLW